MPRTRRKYVQQYYAAWIALLSMLLLVVAPVISQLQMHDERHAALVAAAPHTDTHANHDPLDHVLEACGYCFLLANSPGLIGAADVDSTGPLGAVPANDQRSALQAPRAAPYAPHRPRGPPSALTVADPSSSRRVSAFA